VLTASSLIGKKIMSSDNRMVQVARVALKLLEEVAVKTDSNQTHKEIIALKRSLENERVASKTNSVAPERLKYYEDKVRTILDGQIDVSKIDINEWWDII
jgi:hypothetical protein